MKIKSERERREPTKKSAVLYYDKCDSLINKLSYEDFGKVMMPALLYDMYGDEPESTGNELLDFLIVELCQSFDHAMCEWKKTSNKNRNNVNKRWEEERKERHEEI